MERAHSRSRLTAIGGVAVTVEVPAGTSQWQLRYVRATRLRCATGILDKQLRTCGDQAPSPPGQSACTCGNQAKTPPGCIWEALQASVITRKLEDGHLL
jgi:hypothetical protein